MHQSLPFFYCSLIIQIKFPKTIFVFDTLNTFYMRKFLDDTKICTRHEIVLMRHVDLTPGLKQTQLNFYNQKFGTIAAIVIYADFEVIFEPLNCQAEKIIYSQWHKLCAAEVVFCLTFGQQNQSKVINFVIYRYLNSWICKSNGIRQLYKSVVSID